MEKATGEKQQYTVLFWANPKSGLDVIKKNTILPILRTVLSDMMKMDRSFPERMKKFEEKNEGLVIYEEVIETDRVPVDINQEVMPLIKHKYPNARFISMIPLVA